MKLLQNLTDTNIVQQFIPGNAIHLVTYWNIWDWWEILSEKTKIQLNPCFSQFKFKLLGRLLRETFKGSHGIYAHVTVIARGRISTFVNIWKKFCQKLSKKQWKLQSSNFQLNKPPKKQTKKSETFALFGSRIVIQARQAVFNNFILTLKAASYINAELCESVAIVRSLNTFI